MALSPGGLKNINESPFSEQADMPGVLKDRLGVRIDSDTLSIEGNAVITMPEEMEALYADVRCTRYQRSFSLSRELDVEKIDANLKDGVLTLHIPRREEHKPRNIGVLAHEVSHVRSNDMWVMGLADMFSRLTAWLSLFGQLLLLVNLPLLFLGQITVNWLAILIAHRLLHATVAATA